MIVIKTKNVFNVDNIDYYLMLKWYVTIIVISATQEDIDNLRQHGTIQIINGDNMVGVCKSRIFYELIINYIHCKY